MPLSLSLRVGVVVALLAAGTGCLRVSSSLAASAASSGGSQASSAESGISGSTSAGATGSGTGGSISGVATTGTSTGTSSGAGSSTGSATGRVPPIYVDGGYVWCSVETDAGALTWQCFPGTYFCATDGTETCTQCLSDADCANYDLPTFDPRRQHCDLQSGVTGYQGYCQECITSAQCAGNPRGPYCDPNPKDATAPIVDVGFETCELQPIGCPYGTAPGVGGGCTSTFCSGDAGCANTLNSQQQLTPFCVGGTCAPTPNGDACPNCFCVQGCGQPGSQPLECVFTFCACTEADQCGGPWPVCELADGGEAGTCGCDDDAECGDAGLKCLVIKRSAQSFGGSFCGVSCGDPRFPGCGVGTRSLPWDATSPTTTPLCDTATGLCVGCGSDSDCQTKVTGPTAGPDCRVDGVCGCANSSDCPAGLTCQYIYVQSSDDAGFLGECALPPPPCNPTSCQKWGGYGCEPDSGTCVGVCTTDEDCWGAGAFCDLDAGRCLGCRDDLDCTILTEGDETYCNPNHECGYGCSSDADCTGNRLGPKCYIKLSECGCATDADCPAGAGCSQVYGPNHLVCSGGCQSDGDCPASFFCDPQGICRARCDLGHTCQAPETICDVNDLGMMNADRGAGDAGVVTWCYACLTGSDCPAGEVCECPADVDCK